MKSNTYRGVIKYQESVVNDFQTSDDELAIARISRLLGEEYPYGRGEVIDLTTGKVIHYCCYSTIC